MTRLEQMLQGSPYQGYAYAYPHKTAYRRLPEAAPLRPLWARERRDALFLYFHVPFCEMRCGFCNLFTQPRPREGIVKQYLARLRCEADEVREALGAARFARLAIGGGTPTFLDLDQLEALLDLAVDLGCKRGMPFSVETSPATSAPEKLALLRERGVTRVSIGIQSFIEAETTAAARPQKRTDVECALTALEAARFPILNIDLIYGLPGQTLSSWLCSIEQALQYRPQELYFYPLYVRPLTGLGRCGREWDDQRLLLYRAGRDLLLLRGYEQLSMRLFRRPGVGDVGPVYCCQNDGMVGLGCGARSYTRELHYSHEFAVGAAGVRAVLADYLTQPSEHFTRASHGFRLAAEEQRRRFLIQSILQRDGLDFAAYRHRFSTEAMADFPELAELAEQNLAEINSAALHLNERGCERSDVIGPWLYSQRVIQLMSEYELR